MPIDSVILTDNAAQRARLESLAGRLTDAELGRDLGDGWTVAVALCHLAFWDRRAVLVLERWERDGTLPDNPEPDLLNDALVAEWQLVPPRRAAALAVAAAQAVDHVIERLDARVADAIRGRGEEWRLRRAAHRREHLDQIDQALRG